MDVRDARRGRVLGAWCLVLGAWRLALGRVPGRAVRDGGAVGAPTAQRGAGEGHRRGLPEPSARDRAARAGSRDAPRNGRHGQWRRPALERVTGHLHPGRRGPFGRRIGADASPPRAHRRTEPRSGAGGSRPMSRAGPGDRRRARQPVASPRTGAEPNNQWRAGQPAPGQALGARPARPAPNRTTNAAPGDRCRSGDRGRTCDWYRTRDRYRSGDRGRTGDWYRTRDGYRSGDRGRTGDQCRSGDRYRTCDRYRTRDRYRSGDRDRTGDRCRAVDRCRAGDRRRSG
ncbi:hypothetical protein QO019_002252 [Streptomyces thermodiastaticus]|uniref:Uncharacterized protein n=1 Tax=Streptomyces thermodiastaticus TaxID=44061 RepID=A0ABU0KDE2_9ACTN|nr:hypothetical protein [Streptomyces thermodiastaticus]